jgi:predicted RNA-binding Zn ribbon-like protein
VRHLLSRATLDFLIGPEAGRLAHGGGSGCFLVFVAQRAGRRWCDSRVCGSRARVAAHARRHQSP